MRKISNLLFTIAVVCLCFSLLNGGFFEFLSANKSLVNAMPVIQQSYRLALKLEGADKDGARVSVLRNGMAVATFAQGEVLLLVQDQDEISIDSDLPTKVRVVVSYAASEIVLPRAGDYIYIQNTVEVLGRVLIRRRNG